MQIDWKSISWHNRLFFYHHRILIDFGKYLGKGSKNDRRIELWIWMYVSRLSLYDCFNNLVLGPSNKGFTATLPMTTADMLQALTTAPLEYSYFDQEWSVLKD